MNTDKTKYGVSKEDIRNAALGDFDDFEPVNKPQTDKPAKDPVIPTPPVQPPVQVEPEKEVTVSVEDIPAQQTGDMKFCTECGRQLPSEAKFCTGCGNQMSVPADVQQDVYTDVYSDNAQGDPYQQPVYNDIYSNDMQNDPFQSVDDMYGQDADYPQNDIYSQDYQYQDPYNQQAYQQDPGYAQGAPYQQNVYVQQNRPPVRPLKTDRNGIVALLLSFVTFGIYGLIFNAGISDDVDKICERFDGKKNINFWLMFLLISPLTCGIGGIIWMHCLTERIGRNLKDRGIDFEFNASTYWLWYVLGSFIFVGPFIYMDKLGKAMNLLSEDYNING